MTFTEEEVRKRIAQAYKQGFREGAVWVRQKIDEALKVTPK